MQKRKSGQFKGLIEVSKDFDAPLPDNLLKLFYGVDCAALPDKSNLPAEDLIGYDENGLPK